MNAEERDIVLSAINQSVLDLERQELSVEGCILLVGLLMSVKDVKNDPELIVAREKAKAWIYWTLEGTEEMEEARPYLDDLGPIPDRSKFN